VQVPRERLADVDRFRMQLEAAYVEMFRRWQSGEPPAAFDVPAGARPAL
jgi:hypothetical protein